MVKRNTLLLLACLVWSAAGFNILRIGVLAYPDYLSVWNFLLSALVFAVFQRMVFGKLVKKHTARIRANEEERHFFLKVFDIRSVAAACGVSLLLAGVRFGYHFGKAASAASENI